MPLWRGATASTFLLSRLYSTPDADQYKICLFHIVSFYLFIIYYIIISENCQESKNGATIISRAAAISSLMKDTVQSPQK